MNGTPMTEQVGRLIGNLLAGGGEVFLPGVGSLYTERRPAQRIDRRTVLPPYRVVSFTSQERGVSLVDEIARVMREEGAEAPETAAQEVYDRWLARAREANLLTVEGVGVLAFKNFTPDEAFERRLNPQGREPVKIRAPRRFDWALWLGVAAIAVALVYGGREFLMLYSAEPETVVAEGVAAEPADTVAVNLAELPDAPEGDLAAELPAAGEELPQSAGAVSPSAPVKTVPAEEVHADPGEPMDLLSGRSYVVLGVFSTTENAGRAVREIAAKEPAFRCRIYRFGEKFMVSPFSSDNAGPCAQFIGIHAERFPGMWTYTAR